MRRGEITLNILEALGRGALATAALCAAFAPAVDRRTVRRMAAADRIIRGYFADERERHRLQSMLSSMRKSGLIRKDDATGGAGWSITGKGRAKRKLLRQALESPGRGLPPSTYAHEKAENPIIVAFDIPEKRKHQREWLRSVLKNMQFTMVQESMWMGLVSLPASFMEDL